MIELMVRRYLAEALSVPVRMEMPEHPPDALVLVELQLYGHKHETVPLSGGGGSRLLSMKRRKT